MEEDLKILLTSSMVAKRQMNMTSMILSYIYMNLVHVNITENQT